MCATTTPARTVTFGNTHERSSTTSADHASTLSTAHFVIFTDPTSCLTQLYASAQMFVTSDVQMFLFN